MCCSDEAGSGGSGVVILLIGTLASLSHVMVCVEASLSMMLSLSHPSRAIPHVDLNIRVLMKAFRA
jgi:hypothetical protein